MLDINLVRENPDLVRKALQLRQMDTIMVDQVQELDVPVSYTHLTLPTNREV